ncbi:MAG: VanZ family protein [Lachnospiraceae bacterium]|nr:VanZ family protein [Lachnospiraceae bacterium]
MLKYLIRDLTAAIRYLPYGLFAGVLVAIFLKAINAGRLKKNKQILSVPAITSFAVYVIIILCITFFSRENGASNGIDMKLFSTWGINDRNNAYVIENILLFIPYGVTLAWAVKRARGFLCCALFGVLTSVGIECLQLITARGYFQIDDILTNTLGTIIGYFLFRIFYAVK